MEQLDYFKIGGRIRKYRKLCNFSQEQLAEMVGISTTHLSHIETANTKLSLQVFVDIANALSVQTDKLLNDFPSDKTSAKSEIIDIIDSCTPQETLIIRDVVKATKISLNKYI